MKSANFKTWTVEDLKTTAAYRQIESIQDDLALDFFLKLAGKNIRVYGTPPVDRLIHLFDWSAYKREGVDWQEIHRATREVF